ncbi:MAG: tRNA 2-selenouridine(34) synthase MnmH [Bacteroidetes bacterium 4572_117]|nr:MAG: tRNA 2-selenouridine(34) synthase MnmH [Bacteroidetes bacterium 4572_117]
MNEELEITEFLKQAEQTPVVDVRTPAEFAHAHIPGAHNIPLLTNEERAQVGTLYKKQGKEQAVLLGLEMVGTKLSSFVRQAKKLAIDNKLIVHCWRGGMRSKSMSWLFNTAGIKTITLADGYKAYRRYIKSCFANNHKLIVLGGMTGSGKTEILQAMAKLGEQIVDLEKLAHHKGSAFGSLGQLKQESTEQFENNLFEIWKTLDINKTVWLEDESQAIGSVRIPDELYKRIRASTVIKINLPKAERIKWLVKDYGIFDKEKLKAATLRIAKRLGGLRTKLAIQAIRDNNFSKVADIMLEYYDKAYLHGLSNRKSNNIFEINLNKIRPDENAIAIIDFYNKLEL